MSFQYDNRGFLPTQNPLIKLPDQYDFIESMALDLPDLIESESFKTLIRSLPVVDFSGVQDQRILNRLMMIYAYFASGYVCGAIKETPSTVIPQSISKPLVQLAEMLNVLPILSYSSYCLNNWKIISEDLPIAVDNIELLQKFVKCYDEDWFILIHVDIEYQGRIALHGIAEGRTAAALDDVESLNKALTFVSKGLDAMNTTFARMPEACRPEVYFNTVRPYIFGFENVVYEGCFHETPQTYRGETGAQSSLIPAIQSALGVQHLQSTLTEHLVDMRKYMPESHRSQLKVLEASIPPYDEKYPDPEQTDIRKAIFVMKNKTLTTVYNDCIHALWKFRDMHLQYAVDYIHSKVSGDKGTGGTPYMKWLKQLRDETMEYLI